jgi:hypothetical protein
VNQTRGAETKTPDPAPQLTWDQVRAWRMGRHHLVNRAAPSDLLRVAGDICGLHAQLTSSTELSLWARIDGLDPGAVHQALWQDRTLVKLWAMRGTLHLLPADELGTWLSALGTFTKYGNVGNPEIDQLSNAIGRALNGRLLTREELALAVEQRTGSPTYGEWVRFSWGSYLKAASFRGLLCFAPTTGGNVRFTHPATWVPSNMERLDPAEALREVTRRFLAAYSPATAADLGLWWGGYGPAPGRRMIASLGEEAVEVDVEGHHAWVLGRDVDEIASAASPNTARLLPAFDPWVIGASRTAAALLDPQHKTRVYRPQGWISPVILVNGRIAGVWKHSRKGRRLLVEINPFAKLPAWTRSQIEAEAKRLAIFFDSDFVLEERIL